MTAVAPTARTMPNASRPLPGETQAAFAERYHATMAKLIPETDRRNELMMQASSAIQQEAKLQRLAANRFPAGEFVKSANSPVFAEHTTKDSKGNTVIYDRRALAAIVDRCNARILDTGDFPPLTEGHTPTHEELAAGRKQPEVLGYCGPFRLGQIGNQNPRWAIFADEWHHTQDRDRLSKLRRRSPEVWLEERMEDRFLDPIAALGAETPRLDLGTSARFCRSKIDGRVIAKYSAVAAMPSAMSSFVPGTDSGKNNKDRYEGQSMLNPEDVSQIVEAIMASEPMQWVMEQMNGGPQAAGPEGMPPPEAPAPDAAPAGPPMGAEHPAAAPEIPPAPEAAAKPPAIPSAPANPEAPKPPKKELSDEDKDMMSRYMAGEADDSEMQAYAAACKAKYAADGSVDESPKTPPAGEVDENQNKPGGEGEVANPSLMKLSKRTADMAEKQRYEKLEREVAELREAKVKAEQDREATERYSLVNDARLERAFNTEDLTPFMDPVKYSREAFDSALKIAINNAQTIPINRTLPVPRRLDDKKDGKPTNDQSDRAVALATRYAKEGKAVSYDQALSEVLAQDGKATKTA